MKTPDDLLYDLLIDTDRELDETHALKDWYRDLACEALAVLHETQRQLETARATNAALIEELRETRIGRVA